MGFGVKGWVRDGRGQCDRPAFLQAAAMDPPLEEKQANRSAREVLGRGWMLMGNNPAKPEGSSGKLGDRRAERWQ